MLNPYVSICIPTFNGEQFIVEAMQSAIAQTYSNLEIIVSDDASNDDTLKLIEQFKEKTNIPIYIYHHKPNGIGANWNHCIKKANGKYIKFLFQDDVLKSNCIEKMIQVLETNKSIALVASKREFIIEVSYLNEETSSWIKRYSNLQATLNLPLIDGIRYLDKNLFKSILFLDDPKNKVGEPSAVLFNKKLIQKIGYFREDLKQILDYEFYYRVLKKHKIAVLETELVKFRLHQHQATNVNKGKDASDYYIYDQLIYKEYFWYLNYKKKVEFLKKYHPMFKLFLRIKRKLRL